MRNKIEVTNSVVEIDGDEMTRIIWRMIKEKFIHPYLDVPIQYFDLSIENRDRTNDRVTTEAAKAIKACNVGIKCATITHTPARVKEFNSPAMLGSPNGRIRSILDGTIFREPIIINNIPKAVPGWTEPIIIGRHAFGDQYIAKDVKIPGAGEFKISFNSSENADKNFEILVNDFKGPGVGLGMFNTDESIYGFARSSMSLGLIKKWPVYFSAKDTILKQYDGRFREIFAEVYENEFRKDFEEAGIFYEYKLIDDMVSFVIKSSGRYIWATKNYDGDVESDMTGAGFGSIGLMTSVLITPDGQTMESEAAHGTVTRHYRQHQAGKETSTNPIASIFAWTRGLAFRGKLDNNQELINFCHLLENACIKTVEAGYMTKDLATCIYGTDVRHGEHYMYTDEFMNAIESTLVKSVQATLV